MNEKKSGISTFISGFILSLIGGLISIGIGLVLPALYPELSSGLTEFFLILQLFTIIGGILALIGCMVVAFHTKVGYILILLGGIVGGGNIITIMGAGSIIRKVKPSKSEQVRLAKAKQMEERIGSTLDDKKRWVEEQYRMGRSFREIAEEMGEDMYTVRQYLDDDLEKYRS